MSQDASLKLDDESQLYLARYANRNYALYMLTVLVSYAASSFGDMTAFVPTLAEHLHAPSWIVAFPMVASKSIANAPTLLVAWLMGPRLSRTKAYAASIALMYVPIGVLSIFLFHGASDLLLIYVFTASIILWSLAMGLSLLPCWDLFARIFPDTRRSKITGQAIAFGQFAQLLSAGVAAWFISSKSPLAFPTNYAAAMLIFAIGGLISAGVILFMKEYIPSAPTVSAPAADRSLGKFLREIQNILRTDRQWVSSLKIVALSYSMAAVFPVVLTYVQKYRGFAGANDVAWFIGVRPYIAIPFVLFCGYLAHRIGPTRTSGLLCTLMALGIPLTFILWGHWQLISLFMVYLGETMALFAMLVVMQRAPGRLMHQYLAIYFTACMIPGLAPLALAKLSDYTPQLAMLLIMLICAASAVGFFLLERRASASQADMPATGAAAVDPNPLHP